MAKNNNIQDFIQDLGDTIRKKKGTTAKINPQNFSSEIESIQTATAPTLQSKSVTPSTSQQKVQPDAGYDGLSDVTVNAVTNNIDANIVSSNIRRGVTILGVEGNVDVDKPDQSKTVTPTTQQQRVFADVGYELTDVTVEAVTSSIDTNIKASNIKDGVSILGVTGTLQEGITPEGTLEITENNTYDVTTYASVDVNVESGSSGEYNIEQVTLDDGTCELKITDAAGGGGGSGGSVIGRRYGEFRCVAIDYDGTILKEEWLNTGDVFTLPEFPTHDRLVAQNWSASQEIVDNSITVDDKDFICGAVYTTASGKSEFDIVLNKATGLEVSVRISGTKDWGDGTSDTSTTHTYTDYGEYTISCSGTSMASSSSAGVFNQSSSGYNMWCVGAYLAIPSVTEYAFQWCSGLRTITFCDGTTVGKFALLVTSNLKAVIFPYTTDSTAIQQSCCNKCNAKYIVIPYGYKSLSSNALERTNFEIIVLPDTITTCNSSAFQDCKTGRFSTSKNLSTASQYGIPYPLNNKFKKIKLAYNFNSYSYLYLGDKFEIVDYSAKTTVPTWGNYLISSSQLTPNGSTGNLKIIVPDDLYDTWITTSGWSGWANYIYKASEVK